MPPKRGSGHGARGGGGRSQPKAKPCATPKGWRHLLLKQKHEPLQPQPGNAFLSLKISRLDERVAERQWPLLSARAAIYVPKSEPVGPVKPVKNSPDKKSADKKANLRDQPHNAAFVTLKYTRAAWEQSQIPLVQFWRAQLLTGTTPVPQSKPEPAAHLETKPTPEFRGLNEDFPLLSSTNELVSTTQVATPAESAVPFTTDPSPESALQQGFPIAPVISPLSSGFTHHIHPLTPAESTESPKFSVLPETDGSDPYEMAGTPSVNAGGVDESIKDVIQNLFVMQQYVASFRPEHQDGLNRKVEDVAVSLQKLDDLVSDPNNPVHTIKVAPDIIDYVDDGRNPDIYTRDFVELVQRGNAVMNGKQKAFRNFSKIFAKALKENFDGMDEEVDTIMANAGMEDKNGSFVETHQNGSST